MPQIFLTNSEGTFNITGLVPNISWAGDYRQCARTLDFSLISSPNDVAIPDVECHLGGAVAMSEGEKQLFEGYIVSRTKNTAGNSIDISCVDRGLYLKRNEASRKYVGATPEGAVRELCGAFGVPVGELVATGVTLSRNFLGASLWDIIRTMYALAAEQTGKKYHIGFEGAVLCARTKEPKKETTIIAGGSNLMEATTTESIENMVNAVTIYNSTGELLQTMRREENIKLYGLMQKTLKQTKESVAPQATQLLDEGALEQKITVNCLGDTSFTAGSCVIVQEPYTGLHGLFYIDTDNHQWKNGVYVTKLVLNFKALMDEKAVGEAIK